MTIEEILIEAKDLVLMRAHMKIWEKRFEDALCNLVTEESTSDQIQELILKVAGTGYDGRGIYRLVKLRDKK